LWFTLRSAAPLTGVRVGVWLAGWSSSTVWALRCGEARCGVVWRGERVEVLVDHVMDLCGAVGCWFVCLGYWVSTA